MEKQFQYHPVILRFRNNTLEAQFREYYVERFTVQTRWGCFLGILLYGGFVILDVNLSPDYWRSILTIRLGVVVPYLILMFWVTYTSFFKKHMQVLIGFSILVAGFGHFALALAAGLPSFYVVGVTILLAMFTYTFSGLRAVNALIVSLVLIMFFELLSIFITNLTVSELLFQNFLLVSANIIGLLAGIIVEKYSRNEFISSLVISQEKAKSESLLLNVLPASIAERLKAGETMVADEFSEATVLFADIVDFTVFCSNRSPREVVSMLNQVFSRFDTLVEKYDVEKIKTQGDCYIVTSGLPQHRYDHAETIANLALDMRDILSTVKIGNGLKIQMRFGISSGSISAGIIGTKKFVYDIWGDTVNIASRIESNSSGNLIQVADTTYRALKDKFRFRPGGKIDVKGRGKIIVYYLEGRL